MANYHGYSLKELEEIATAVRISECASLLSLTYQQAKNLLKINISDKEVADAIDAYNNIVNELEIPDKINNFSNKNQAFKSWQENEYVKYTEKSNEFVNPISIAFELSSGCSQQCVFCGLAAQPLSKIYFATDENLKEFEAVYDFFKNLIGDAAIAPMLYYASEPLDNPDYFKFSELIHQKSGCYPHLTTTQYLRKRDFLHPFLSQSVEDGNICHRFSVLNVHDVLKIYNEYTALEMLYTRLESRYNMLNIAPSGRAFRNPDLETGKSIACCFGFIVNFASHSLRLETPTIPSKKHPNGTNLFIETNWKKLYVLEHKVRSIIDSL